MLALLTQSNAGRQAPANGAAGDVFGDRLAYGSPAPAGGSGRPGYGVGVGSIVPAGFEWEIPVSPVSTSG